MESKILSQKNVLRLFVILTVILAISAGLGWNQYSELLTKYNNLQKRHDRLNRIYIQQNQ